MADEPEIWISDDPGSNGAQRRPGLGRWIALAAGFAALLALIAVQHFAGNSADTDAALTPSVTATPPPSTSRPTSSPTTAGSTETPHSAPRSTTPSATAPATVTISDTTALGGWELVGFQWFDAVDNGGAAVVRYRPGTGELVTTPVPPLMSNGPFSFVATTDAVVIRPMDHVPALVVPDGRPAEIAGGMLTPAYLALPGPRPDRVWVAAPDGDAVDLILVDSTGRLTGPVVKPPASLGIHGGYGMTRDGDGAVLASAIGGVYDLRPGETRLVTHGTVLAAGPTGYLVYECDEAAHGSPAVVDRASRTRTVLGGYAPSEVVASGQSQGVISPDGRHAALFDYSAGPHVVLVDLRTGDSTVVGTSPNSQAPLWGDAASLFAFTPDSDTLLVAAAAGVDVVESATGTVRGRLPVPTLAAIAIRPLG
jgi:hypothetical protein